MDIAAKQELARLIRDTIRTREASYIQGTFQYAKTWDEAVDEVCKDPDLRYLIYAAAASGYADFPDWADAMLKQKQAA